MLKSYKLTKKMMKDAEELLGSVGAIDKTKNQAYPYHTYMCPKDYKNLERNVRAAFKKKYPFLAAKKLEFSVGMHLLNLGPVELDGIREGYILVDESAINRGENQND